MGWFTKDKKKEEEKIPSLPKLPELPKINSDNSLDKEFDLHKVHKENLPQLPESEEDDRTLHRLPSYPGGKLGDKFSQNTIKEAVSGEKKGDVGSADDFEELDLDSKVRTMHEPLKTPKVKEIEKEDIPHEFKEAARKVQEAEPVFIRLDKFEEGVQIFHNTKARMSEIEQLLKDTKRLKEEEEKELENWEAEIEAIKTEIEKVEKNIFSKIK